MSAPARPRAIFLPATRPQAEDALAVARELAMPTWFVPLWTGILDGLGAEIERLPVPPAVRRLAPDLPRQALRMLLINRGRALVRRLRRWPQPPVLVFGDDISWVEAAMAKLAVELGLPTLLIQDGLLDAGDAHRLADPPRRFSRATIGLLRRTGALPAEGQYLYGSTRFSRIAAYSDFARELMVGWGAPPEAIRVTGAPRFDALLSAPPPKPRGGERPALLYIGLLLHGRAWAPADADRRWIAGLARAAADHRDWRVALRPHPVDDCAFYREALASAPGGSLVEVATGGPIHQALVDADVAAMHFPSTVLVEALALERPVAFVDLGLPRLHNVYERDPGLVAVASPDSLGSAVEPVLGDARLRAEQAARGQALVERYMGPRDGGSARRVASLVRELAS